MNIGDKGVLYNPKNKRDEHEAEVVALGLGVGHRDILVTYSLGGVLFPAVIDPIFGPMIFEKRN